jgi:hypothetical protein
MRLGRSIGGASPLELTWLVVAEAAHTLAVSENTVKTHLPNIFAKTRSSRQARLMKFVNDLRSPLRQVQGGNASSDNDTAKVPGAAA